MGFYSKLKKNQFLRGLVYRGREIRSKFSYNSGRRNVISIKGINISTKIQIKGNDNKVIVMGGVVLKHASIYIGGSDNTILISSNAFLEKSSLHIENNNCIIEIGEGSFIGPSHLACTENGSKLQVGSNCMVSSNVNIRTGDSHSILDSDGNRINYAESVHIGNHVWIGEGAKILKGSSIGENSVVATGAIVTKKMPAGCLIGGIPAKILKENINWDSKRL